MRKGIPALLGLVLLAACSPAPGGDPSPAASASAAAVTIFLGSNTGQCDAVSPVLREVDPPPSLEKALVELLEGPTASEAAEGLGGWFDRRTAGMLNSVRVEGGVAQVDFDDLRPVIPNASSSCGSAGLLAQLDSTVRSSGEARDAVYSIGGDVGTFYEWLQLAPPDP